MHKETSYLVQELVVPHEHVVVDGKVGRLQHPIWHENWHSLYRSMEHSEWEAKGYYPEGRARRAVLVG